MTQESNLHRALAQQLASLSAAGVQQVGRRQASAVPLLPPMEKPAEGLSEKLPESSMAASAEPAIQPSSAARHVNEDRLNLEKPVVPSPVPSPAGIVPSKAETPKQSLDVPSTPSGGESELEVLSEKISGCTLCDELCANRTQTVFGVGNPQARLCFLGEAPGADEDRLGEPFVGPAGQLLTKIIQAMGLTRDDVYILNVLKCRPLGNRNPEPKEVANCRPYFEEQLSIIKPEFICCLGAVAAQNLLDTNVSISKMRGEFQDWKGYKVMATYHPAYLLRNPAAKKAVWKDMQVLLKAMEMEVPKP